MRPGRGGRHYAGAGAPDSEPLASTPLISAIMAPNGQQNGHDHGPLSPVGMFAEVPRPRTETSAHVSGELPVDEMLEVSGELPLEELPEPSGELPLDELMGPSVEPEDDTELTDPAIPVQYAEEAEELAAAPVEPEAAAITVDGEPIKRTKVTLTPPVKRQEEVRVYAAPPPDGLSKFDLGSVPASVTPPRTWRKAAWFAAVSSGGVVVALLVASSYLVGKPTDPSNIADTRWPDLQGVQPYFDQDSISDPTYRGTVLPSTLSPSSRQRIKDAAGTRTDGPYSSLPAGTTQATTTVPGSPSGTGSPTATTSSEPQKPPPTPAERETKTPGFGFYADPEVMGDRSERFLNAITEDPEQARQETGGSLYAEGAESMAADYADIAYFEVEQVYIDQQNRQTVNTVTVVWMDGHRTSEQRTLRFDDGDKITSDGT